MTDRLTVELAATRALAESSFTYDDWHELGRRARRLVRAVDAVLAEHCEAASEPGWCQECGFTWPCSTVEAITREVTA